MIPTVESRFCPYVDKGAITNSVNPHSLTSTAIKNPPLLDPFYTRTMILQYYGHSHPQTRYTSTPLEILLVVCMTETPIVRLCICHYEIIVAISGIKSTNFNPVHPYYGCFRYETLELKDPPRSEWICDKY